MSSSNKCNNCGSLDLDTDPARGDVVCTNCGTVLEHSAIVSEVQFLDNSSGGCSVVGQFVAADSKGGARGFGQSFHTGLGKESREITYQNAKRSITNLAHQLSLNQHCIDTAFNFFKMALNRQLTRGRKNTHVVAACLYITCRTENTPHMLIDFSDVLQIDVYELGRTYLKLSQALSINIPSMDPCIYVMRFAAKLDFGEKEHAVSMTAQRLVQRMKKDSIHTGRRPSGLCGAALLMSARLHDFNRSIEDVIKIVKVHESTLRKRLMEFGETPSSALTLDEFMTVDLEEEQDPPSYKAARKKDKERLQKLMEEQDVTSGFTQLQSEIERQLEERKPKSKRAPSSLTSSFSSLSPGTSDLDPESEELHRFASTETLGAISACLPASPDGNRADAPVGLGPSIASMGLLPDYSSSRSNNDQQTSSRKAEKEETGEIDLEDIDDNEIDSYIMTEQEASNKDFLWMKVNATYLKEQKEKEEKLKRDQEEGKPEKKKRKPSSKRNKNNCAASSNTPEEAIQKMLKEKKLSAKINYDVLKSLNINSGGDAPAATNNPSPVVEPVAKRARKESASDETPTPRAKPKKERAPRVATAIRRGKAQAPVVLPVVANPDPIPADPTPADPTPAPASPVPEQQETEDVDDMDDMDDDDAQEQDFDGGMSLSQMLNKHRGNDDYYGDGGYDDEDY